MSEHDEIKNTTDRLLQASEKIAGQAAEIQATSNSLAEEVVVMGEKIKLLEANNDQVAKNLVDAKELVSEQQAVQDGRLDALEP